MYIVTNATSESTENLGISLCRLYLPNYVIKISCLGLQNGQKIQLMNKNVTDVQCLLKHCSYLKNVILHSVLLLYFCFKIRTDLAMQEDDLIVLKKNKASHMSMKIIMHSLSVFYTQYTGHPPLTRDLNAGLMIC